MITSWSRSATTARMKKCNSSLEDFMDIFKPENVRERDTKDGVNYIAGQLLDYTKPRGKGNIIDRCAVVLDCDDADPAGIKALCEGVRSLGVLSVVHSTYSSTPDKPKVRVVIPLKDVVVPGDYVSLCKALMAHLNMVEWDESCAQAERIMYAPAKPTGGEYWAIQTEGPLMNPKQWLEDHAPKTRKQRTSKGNVAKRDKRRNPKNDKGIQGAFNRVYTIADAIETFDLPYEPCRDGRWTHYEAESQGGLRLVEGREDLCISEHANSDPACFIDGNGSHRALSAFELCAVHLYGEDDDTSLPPRERASMQAMANRAIEDEAVQAQLGDEMISVGLAAPADVSWLADCINDTYTQAEHAAHALRDRLAYVEGLSWLVYVPERGIWQITNESTALNCIADVIRTWYSGVMVTGDADLIKKVGRLRHVSTPRAILAHILAMLSLPIEAFDADRDLLCALNGVVDLRTGKLKPHDPKYRMTLRANASYVPGATHEAWDKALEALGTEEREWWQVWIGCGITGYQPDDHGAAVPILTGTGSNGKSVIMTGIARALGKYAYMGSLALLMPDSGKDLLRAAAHLRSVRLAYIEEFPDGTIHSTALKQMSSTPTMKGEFKFKSEFTFNTTHSLMVSANTLPRLDEGTSAVVRRLAVLPFEYRYVANPSSDREKLMDANLLRALETPEAQAAILAWAIKGAIAYFAAGQHVLPATASMQAKKDEWLNNNDVLAEFFSEMLIEDPEAMIPMTHLYAAFNARQGHEGRKIWNKSTFRNRISSHRLFSDFKSGKLSTSGMSLYCDEYGNAPKAPTGGRVNGLRGLRFRTAADEAAEAAAEAAEAAEAAAEAANEAAAEALIPTEDIPTPTPHIAPEREEVERQALIEEIEGLACFVHTHPGGIEEVNRLVEETGCTGPNAPLSKLRAFKIRLEGTLVRLSIQQQE